MLIFDTNNVLYFIIMVYLSAIKEKAIYEYAKHGSCYKTV